MHSDHRQSCTHRHRLCCTVAIVGNPAHPTPGPSSLLLDVLGAYHLLSAEPVRNCFEPLGGDGATAPDIDSVHLSADPPIGDPIPATALPPLFPHRQKAHDIP